MFFLNLYTCRLFLTSLFFMNLTSWSHDSFRCRGQFPHFQNDVSMNLNYIQTSLQIFLKIKMETDYQSYIFKSCLIRCSFAAFQYILWKGCPPLLIRKGCPPLLIRKVCRIYLLRPEPAICLLQMVYCISMPGVRPLSDQAYK